MRNFFNTPINAFLIFVVLAAIIVACTAGKPNEETVIPNYDTVYPQTKHLVVKHANGWDQHVKITGVDFEFNGHTYILFLDENRHYERIGIIHHPNCPCTTIYNDIEFE
jgi:hypothetical protein